MPPQLGKLGVGTFEGFDDGDTVQAGQLRDPVGVVQGGPIGRDVTAALVADDGEPLVPQRAHHC
ncbi:hypothetical protein [Georgenia sp. AZ-5]|uniref:hypothetical protein n=1 Tax=Georgenia sp. AZ-5 TaxID=3367526 RepID=UPI003754EFA3